MSIDKAEVLNRINFETFYRDHIKDLKKNGNGQALGRCPFHDDAHASLSVELSAPGRFNCFACGKSGDTFSFWQEIKGGSFSEAVEGLARYAGITVEQGKPAEKVKPRIVARFDYFDEKGNLIYWRERIEPGRKGQNKEFIPYHIGPGGEKTAGRGCDAVIYRLPDVLKHRAIIITEGEKHSDLLASWGLPATSLDSGAQSKIPAKFTEWLAGKRVAILPDNDAPGRKYAANIGAALAGKVESLKIVELPGLPEKGDICDWVEIAGNDKGKLIEIIKAAPDWKPGEPTPDAGRQEPGGISYGIPEGFIVNDRGVFYRKVSDKGEVELEKLASALYPVALSRDADFREWGLLVEFKDCDGRLHRLPIEKAALAGDGSEARRALLEEGLPEVSPKPGARGKFLEFLLKCAPIKRLRAVNKVGWHGSAFVMPGQTIGGNPDEEIIFQGVVEHYFRQAGSLQEWQGNVAAPCRGNSRLVFALSVAAAAPLLDITGEAGGGFHFVCSSSKGKTTALLVGGSLWGGGGRLGFARTWRATTNGLEGVCALHNDSLLCLDELSQLESREAGTVAYLIGNGSGKERMNRAGGMRNPSRWNLLFLSSGEVGLADHVKAAGGRNRAGQTVRMVDIAADAGKGLGLFEDCHGHEPSEFAGLLADSSRKFYGTGIIPFIEFVEANRKQLAEEYSAFKKDFISRLCPSANGEVSRVAARFALVAAAGELAIEAGIFPWPEGSTLQAVEQIFNEWVASQGEGRADDRAALSQVRLFLEQHGASRFQKVAKTLEGISPSESAEKIINRAGFRMQEEEEIEYWVLQEVFKEEVCRGFNAKQVAECLKARGFLRGEGGRNTLRRRMPELGQKRCYVISGGLLDESPE